MLSSLFVTSTVTPVFGVGDVPAARPWYATGFGYKVRGRIRVRGERGNSGAAATAEIVPASIGIVGIAITVIAVSTTTKRGAWCRVRVMMVADPGHA